MWLGQKIGRLFLDKEIIEPIRGIKFNLNSEEELFDTEALVMTLKIGLSGRGV